MIINRENLEKLEKEVIIDRFLNLHTQFIELTNKIDRIEEILYN